MVFMQRLAAWVGKGVFHRSAWGWGMRASMTSVPFLPYLGIRPLTGYDILWRIDAAYFVLVAFLLGWTYRKYLIKFARYIVSYPLQGLMLALVYLIVSGLMGAGLGLPALIWNEEPWTRFFSAMGATLVLAVVGVSAYYLIPIEGPGGRLVRDDVLQEIEDFLGDRRRKRPTTLWGWVVALGGNPLGTVLLDWTDWLPDGPPGPGGHPELYNATYVLRIFRTPDVSEREDAHHLSRFLRFSRLPFLALLALPALLPVFYSQVPQHAPVIKDIQTGERYDWARSMGSNVVDSFPAFLYSLVVWLLGIVAGVWLVKAMIQAGGIFRAPWAVELWERAAIQRHRAVRWLRRAARPWLAALDRWARALRPRGGDAAPGQAEDAGQDEPPASPPSEWERMIARRLQEKRTSILAFFLVVLVFYTGMNWSLLYEGGGLTRSWSYQGIAPGLAIMLLLGQISVLSAFLTIRYSSALQRLLILMLVVLWIALANAAPFSYRFERLSYPDSSAAKGSDLKAVLKTAYATQTNDDTPEEEKNPPGVAARPAPARPVDPHASLVDQRASLEAWKALCKAGSGTIDGRPKLVVVCVSGGATRAAYWAATVVDRLARENPPEAELARGDTGPFNRNVRLITGASGGMVGMSYYVRCLFDWACRDPALRAKILDALPEGLLADYWITRRSLERANRDNTQVPGQYLFTQGRSYIRGEVDWIANLPMYSLRPVARYMALRNVWQMIGLRSWDEDRGIELEKDWEALRIPLSCFREAERAGRIPSLVFSPMTVDDGRRLLISNLDLAFRPDPGSAEKLVRLLPLSRGSSLLDRNDGSRLSNYSLSGLEFYKAFPIADGKNEILLSTAARMSASFPLVSPAVNLPSDPPLRVVDAGYFDNYGVDVAAAWLFRNRHWLEQNTSGVLMIQVRDALSSNDRLGVPTPPSGWSVEWLLQGLQFFFSPLDGAMQARYSSSSFRNDERVSALSDLFADESGRRDFFTTAVFELSANLTLTESDYEDLWPGDDLAGQIVRADASGLGEVAMNWYLTTVERKAIIRAIPNLSKEVMAGKSFPPQEVEARDGPPVMIRRLDRAQLKNRCCRLERIKDLNNALTKPLEPRTAAVILKELARARNFEVVEAVKAWWKVDHLKGPLPDPKAVKCTHM